MEKWRKIVFDYPKLDVWFHWVETNYQLKRKELRWGGSPMKNRPDFRGLPTAWKVNKKRLLFDEMPVKSQLFVLISSTPKSKFIREIITFPISTHQKYTKKTCFAKKTPWCLPKKPTGADCLLLTLWSSDGSGAWGAELIRPAAKSQTFHSPSP